MENVLCSARKKAISLGLPMKIISFHRDEAGTLTFLFEAENRIDFREYVRELNGQLGESVRLEQIGPRDVAKNLGGIGPCGKPLCCHKFLNEFKSITNDLIKNQTKSQNISQFTGSCGKLMCCLSYEYEGGLKKGTCPKASGSCHVRLARKEEVLGPVENNLPKEKAVKDPIQKLIPANILEKPISPIEKNHPPANPNQPKKKKHHFAPVKKKLPKKLLRVVKKS